MVLKKKMYIDQTDNFLNLNFLIFSNLVVKTIR
jgi:hypothetical protein